MSVASVARSAIPAGLKHRLRAAYGQVSAIALRGGNVHCSVCGGSFRRFLPYNGRPNAACPRCGSKERHRAAVAFWRDRLGLFTDPLRVLHVAPEHWLDRLLRAAPNLTYITGDLEPGKADIVLDLTAVDSPDGSFDVVLCSHVLEHIPDDTKALSEIRRILTPSGRAFLVVPHDPALTDTYEDPTITTPEGREAAFGQFDHVRFYSRTGFEARVRAAGFEVENLSQDTARHLGWTRNDLAVLARPA
jgi:SAM-dependent methyltransferase